MWIIWLAIFILSLVIEGSTLQLVSIFFSVGSLVALFLSLIKGIPFYIQILVFTVLSLVSLAALRPLIEKVLNRQKKATNVDELIGKEVMISKDYENYQIGEAEVNGLIWNVLNEDEKEPLKVGDEATVVAVRGNKLIVKKKKGDKETS